MPSWLEKIGRWRCCVGSYWCQPGLVWFRSFMTKLSVLIFRYEDIELRSSIIEVTGAMISWRILFFLSCWPLDKDFYDKEIIMTCYWCILLVWMSYNWLPWHCWLVWWIYFHVYIMQACTFMESFFWKLMLVDWQV